MRFPDLLILRHGETEWNRAGRLQGASDSALTGLGRQQAARQGEILAGFDLDGWDVFCSPSGRAQHTARLALPFSEVATEPRLREIGLGDWTGLLRRDIALDYPGVFQDDGLGWYDHAPGGEGLTALAVRVTSFLSDLRRPAVIVTHGITSRVMRCVLMQRSVEEFDRIGGGQGVVYHLLEGRSICLS